MRRALESLVQAAPLPRVQPLLEALEPRVLLSADPVVPRIDGRIDVAGEVDRYTFTLNSNVRVVFDSLTADTQLQWSLSGPQGAVLGPSSPRTFCRWGTCSRWRRSCRQRPPRRRRPHRPLRPECELPAVLH